MLSRSTVGAILVALHARGWVQRLPDLSYELGPALLGIAYKAREKLMVPAMLDAELDRLALRVGCGAALSMLSGDQLSFIAVTAGRGLIPAGISPGTQLPLAPPAGAAIVAFSDLSVQRTWLSDPAGDGRRAELEQVLHDIRIFGVSVWGMGSASMPTLDVLADVAYRLSQDPTDNGLRQRVQALFVTLGGSAYDHDTLSADIDLPISYLTAPVFDVTGRAKWELQIGPLRPHVSKAQREDYIEELKTTARRLSANRHGAEV
jgi:DNA-binding IclR family transcriptional regulator